MPSPQTGTSIGLGLLAEALSLADFNTILIKARGSSYLPFFVMVFCVKYETANR